MPPDRSTPPAPTHEALHRLHRDAGGVHQVFSQRVADYVAARPDYPLALFDVLASLPGPDPGVASADGDAQRGRALWVDVGAGTGLLSQGLLAHGFRVVAVEPSEEMRAAVHAALGANPDYSNLAGSAEALPLPDGSADGIAAAQAFHWFDPQRAREECLRVLKPHGQVALIWNDRVADDPLHLALAEVFATFGGTQREAMLTCGERAEVPRFFGQRKPVEHAWPHQHQLSEQGLLSLVQSRSYMPARDSQAGRAAAVQVRTIFRRFARGGVVGVRYTTVAIIGRPA